MRGVGSVMILVILAIYSLSSQSAAKCMSAFCSSGIRHRAGVYDLKIGSLTLGSLDKASTLKERVELPSLSVIDSASKCGDSILAHNCHSNMLWADWGSVRISLVCIIRPVFIKQQVLPIQQAISSVMIDWRQMLGGQTASALDWNKPVMASVGRSLVMEIQTHG